MVTTRLVKAGELLGIQVLDHLIFSDESFRSMLEENELSGRGRGCFFMPCAHWNGNRC
jgi:hypothetical protein